MWLNKFCNEFSNGGEGMSPGKWGHIIRRVGVFSRTSTLNMEVAGSSVQRMVIIYKITLPHIP